MRFAATRKSRAAVINITPLIDIMFLLVIFLLISAKFEPKGGIAVDLPQGQSAEVPESNRVYELVITYTGDYYLKREKIGPEDLPERIRQIRRTMRDPILVIKADKEVPWEKVVAVTDIAKRVGQTKVNFKIKP